MAKDTKDQSYDSEPVMYCSRCLSLKVKYEESIDSDYCADCGSTDIHEAPFEMWEKMYENRYGHKFIQKEKNSKKRFFLSLTIEELKFKVYKSDKWLEIIKAIYPTFPGGYSKADSIILFFHTLIEQNRIDELKLLFYKHLKF